MKKLVSVALCVMFILSCSVCHASIWDEYKKLEEQIKKSNAAPSSVSSDFDLSSMSLEELIDLQQQITMAMWETEEWQEVTVPAGVYRIGKDIPAGHWTISAERGYVDLVYGDMLNESLTDISWEGDIYEYANLQAPDLSMNSVFGEFLGEDYAEMMDSMYESSWSINLIKGHFLVISRGTAIFTPYTGANLGFKF